jgi:arylsulfatase
VGWANAANAPFREHKMWAHEGGISTPLIACWPGGIRQCGAITSQVAHVTDLMPTLLDLAGVTYPKTIGTNSLTPLVGVSMLPVLKGGRTSPRALAWEHEGNRAIRIGDWKLVAAYRDSWELYDLSRDRTERCNLAAANPGKVAELIAKWQRWADAIGIVPWSELPGSNYAPTPVYRRKSELIPIPSRK